MRLENKKIVVVGAGVSGLAVCRFALEQGAEVVLSDRRPSHEITALLPGHPALTVDGGGHRTDVFCRADLIVISPGVQLSLPALVAAQQAGVPIIGEVELASRYLHCPLLAITGTNGKSTTTELLGAMLRRCGQRVFVGGNLGTPLISAVGQALDYAVVELSSFQLESIVDFRPHYAALLNLSADHLDRYPDMDAYAAAKQRIFVNQTAEDFAIVNGDDDAALALAASGRARQILFSSSRALAAGISCRDGLIQWCGYGRPCCFDSRQLQLSGDHNIENVMAALIPALHEGFDPELLWQAACDFGGLPHRMVRVRELDGVTWYNDSKGTNPGSVMKSVSGLKAPLTLIAGGKDKGGDYQPLTECLRGKVTQLILLGEAAARMEQAWRGLCPIHRVTSMEQAVLVARQVTMAGGSVLLSPGCSSFDMFRSFEQRGEVFSAAVLALPAADPR